MASVYWREIKRSSSTFNWIVLFWKYSMNKRRISHICSYAVRSSLLMLLFVHYRPFFTNCLSLILIDFLFFSSSFLSRGLSGWQRGSESLATSVIKRRFFNQKSFFSFFSVLHLSSHNDHFELLLDDKVILLNKFLLLFSFC